MSLYDYLNTLPGKRETLEYETQDAAYEAGWKLREQVQAAGEGPFVNVETGYLRVRLSIKEFDPEDAAAPVK